MAKFMTIRLPGIVAAVFIFLNLVILPVNAVRAETLTIATISSNPVEEIRLFQGFADYLAAHLKADGIDAVKVMVATDISEMVELLKSKQADLFVDSSVTALVVNTLSGSDFLVRRWKKGRGKYRSVIFTLKESALTSLDDLKGKIIAYEEPFSTSGFMLPILALQQHGLISAPLNNFRSAAMVGQVGYVMAYDNGTQVTWLERGHVQAAAMAEKDFLKFRKTTLKPFRVIYTTAYVPYHVISHRQGLKRGLVDRIRTILMTANQSETGKKVLKEFERTTQFDEIPDDLRARVETFKPFLNVILSAQ